MFTPDLLQGKRILISGGGSGLGQAMALRFAELGARPVVLGRRADALAETDRKIQEACGFGVQQVSCDVRDPKAVEDAIERIWAEGPLDGLVNNAAGNILSKTEDLSHRAVDAVLGIVLHGSAYLTLACGKRWIAEKRKGNVLSIVTTYAWTGSAFVVPSAMGKAGVLALTRSLAVEWGPKGIRLNAIAPGPFPTPGAWKRLVPDESAEEKMLARIPLGRFGAHRELTDLASYLMSEGSGFITGEVVTIDGGEWLKGAGEFSFLEYLSDEDWEKMRRRRG